jgi:septum site-determining protein MinC
MEARAASTRQTLRLRGRSYVAFALCPTVPIAGWLEELDCTLARSPGFFVGKPVVLDMSGVEFSQPAIAHLVASLAERNIRILGIEGVKPNQLTGAMPPLLTGGRLCALEPSEAERPEAKPPQPRSLLLDSPVRSGQSVAFAEGDVTVLGSVGSGAEIVAGGSIHIYGTLRGRAMAGVNGNATARIYCQRIEAELLAIDGYYRTAEDINTDLRNRPIQAWLDGNIMRITPLN